LAAELGIPVAELRAERERGVTVAELRAKRRGVVVPLFPTHEGGLPYCPLDLVESFLRRFIAYPSEHALVAHVLWIAHAHLIASFETSPRLAFMSAEKESGKTRALEITSLFVPNPRLSFSMSSAALVRLISAGADKGVVPTILFDEVDNVFGRVHDEGTFELRAALNSGYRRGATSFRATKEGNVVEFSCYAPLAMAGLRSLPDTIASRTIFVHMRRRAPEEQVESFRLRYHPAEAKPIREHLAAWCEANEPSLPEAPPLPVGIEDRAADIWEPLFAIADVAGDDWPARARAAAIYLLSAAADDTTTTGVELLAHIREAFLNADAVWTSTLLQRLREREESPWADIHGKPLTDRGLADRLRPYRIKSRDVKRDGTNRKGYFRVDFAEAWKRYLPGPDLNSTHVGSPDATSATSATFQINKNNLVAEVAEVALRTPPSEENQNYTHGAEEA
jgi:hypothetical protein